MSASQRRKGAEAELEVAAVFRAAGFDCDRTPASGGLRIKGDLYGNLPLHVEVKRQERLKLPEWLGQLARDCGDRLGVLAFRQNRDRWYAVLELDRLVELVADAERWRQHELEAPPVEQAAAAP